MRDNFKDKQISKIKVSKKMKLQDLFLVTIISIVFLQLINGQPHKNCPTRCGNVTIEYPFGISPGCYFPGDNSFNLTCNQTSNQLIFGGNEVINISHNGQLRVLVPTSYICYNKQGNLTRRASYRYSLGNLTFSNTNKFTAVGCNTYAFLTTFGIDNYSTGCMSICNSPSSTNGTCSGRGCCQTSVSNGRNFFRVRPNSFSNHTSVHTFNPCSYAFLVEDGGFNFNALQDLKNLGNVTRFPVVLDWSIGKQTCKEVGNRSLCGGNSTCFDSSRGIGYICQCNEGYSGNPYLQNGCQDIDECTSTVRKHNCADAKTCRNLKGGFFCKCPSGYRLDSTRRCKRKDVKWSIILLGTMIGFLILLLGVSLINQKLRKEKEMKLRQKFFEQNGGVLLRQRLLQAGASNVDVKIFTQECMKTATNDYDESRILGEGGQGTVYKGILPENSIVAIKKAKLGDHSQVEQFINEVIVLSQINHRNVVKLLGCCLETEVPLLVYEFVNNGTLFDHLHSSNYVSSLTWKHRLTIAIEVAETLSYLHSSASIPIIHRDIKTANILLDEHLTAKVADFGASRLIPMDQEQLTTMVQGTLGYLDPEYYNTGLLNEKSDVYSFGVVLMELVSGQKALCFERYSKHLVSYIGCAMKEDRLSEIIDKEVIREDNYREIMEVVRVAVKCTRVIGEERPKMKEVAKELEVLTRSIRKKDEWLDHDEYPGKIEQLVDGRILSMQCGNSSYGYDSIKNVAMLDIETGR